MRAKALLTAWVLILGLAAVQAGAQDYRIGPGDVLDIWVFGEDDISRLYEVGLNGYIDFPMIGPIKVSGLTVNEIKESLVGHLGEDYLVNPQLQIQIKEYNSQKVYVLGAVAKPGYYEVRGETTILELIGRAGGVTAQGGQNFYLVRGGQPTVADPDRQPDMETGGEISEPIIIDSRKLLDEGDVSLNLELQGGDILYVPKGEEVFVYGEVKKPGSVKWADGLTVLRAVSLAGGPSQLAATKRVQIIRTQDGTQQKYEVNLRDISKGKDPDFPLMPDDIVVVPRSVL